MSPERVRRKYIYNSNAGLVKFSFHMRGLCFVLPYFIVFIYLIVNRISQKVVDLDDIFRRDEKWPKEWLITFWW